MEFKEIKMNELQLNPFSLIGKDWALVTAGNKEKFNTMTVSWGGLGVFWNKNVVTVYIRPQRYTKKFVDEQDRFTLSFYEEGYRETLAFCGSVSGKDVDKVKEANLTPYFDQETPYFAEAKMVFVCKKIYHFDMEKGIMDEEKYKEMMYANNDYHTMYIAEIEKILVRE